MRVELSAEAEAQVKRIDDWWRVHRPSAPDLFVEELEEALLALEQAPALGARYPRQPHFRRLLLRRTRHHLYIVNEQERVYVAAVWSTSRGRGPRL